jgi:SMODS and SLOG-associating 2TM effector domain 1
VIAVVLGVLAGAGAPERLAAWVPVVTTVAASLTAHVAASRYHHQIVEFLRTAQQLDHIVAAHADGTIADSAMVDECERVISVENQGWMANWSKSG